MSKQVYRARLFNHMTEEQADQVRDLEENGWLIEGMKERWVVMYSPTNNSTRMISPQPTTYA